MTNTSFSTLFGQHHNSLRPGKIRSDRFQTIQHYIVLANRDGRVILNDYKQRFCFAVETPVVAVPKVSFICGHTRDWCFITTPCCLCVLGYRKARSLFLQLSDRDIVALDALEPSIYHDLFDPIFDTLLFFSDFSFHFFKLCPLYIMHKSNNIWSDSEYTRLDVWARLPHLKSLRFNESTGPAKACFIDCFPY